MKIYCYPCQAWHVEGGSHQAVPLVEPYKETNSDRTRDFYDIQAQVGNSTAKQFSHDPFSYQYGVLDRLARMDYQRPAYIQEAPPVSVPAQFSRPEAAAPAQADQKAATAVLPELVVIDGDNPVCRGCGKTYRWPMEASRDDEYHLCLRCEHKGVTRDH